MSRSRPVLFEKCLSLLLSKCRNHEGIEIICRLDSDDPFLRQYLDLRAGWLTFIVGSRMYGYQSFGTMIDQCARLSTGDLLWQWGDDAQMVTDGYDVIVEDSVKQSAKSIFVLSSQLTSNLAAGNYPFGFFAIPRKLYELSKSFSLGQSFGYDRCYDALAKYYDCEVKSGVCLNHEYQFDQVAKEGIDKVSERLENGREAYFSAWDEVGRLLAQEIKGMEK